MPNPVRIGIDLDGVIIDHREHKRKLAGDRGFALESWQLNSNVMGRYMPEDAYEELQQPLYSHLTPLAPPIVRALEVLPSIKGELYIISARRSDTVRHAQEWLLKHRVYDVVPAERIFFCGSGDEKRGYCDRLGIHTFLDDKVSVLDALPGKTRRVLFDQDGIADVLGLHDRLPIARSWDEFASLVKAGK